MKLNIIPLLLLSTLAAALTGCHSSIVPLKPAALGPPWALSRPPATTKPSTDTAVAEAARNAAKPIPALQIRQAWFANAKNGTTRIITLTHYHNVWRHSKHLLINMGYNIQWASYRLGVITTRPRTGPEILQWWRPDATTVPELIEGTINTFRRVVRVIISRTGNPHAFAITVEVLVQRRENPQGTVGNVAFSGPSAFGGNALPLQSHHATGLAGQYWMRVGHDPALERKILHRLFGKL